MIARLAKVGTIIRPFHIRNTPRFHYITPIEKPISSLALNSIIQTSAECMQISYCQWAIYPQLSVIMGAFAFRFGIQFLGLFFQSLNLKNKNTWAHRWIQKIFLVDLKRDIAFYEMPSNKYTQLAENYKPQQLFAQFLKVYTLLNFFRGGFYLITSSKHHQFAQLGLFPLAEHDPYFFLPVIVIGLNYLILSRSRHPFLIHMVRPQNKLMCFNIAFMSGLLFVGTPSIFSYSYIGIGLAHLLLRFIRFRVNDWKEYFKTLFVFKKKT